ncbi:AglZ/HisF2 family acetamidino modification protein [Vibrio rotiferianus]|uniref:AglZ/HisF2 family acetamidino modification protein n=1 Tax=Vibrio rotiferianus TaxID=190895 RepID=UPI00148E68CB|nr:AglZ/HisF2 family acetamidino modification protein [Vibrio rotiferianus]NOH65227.1 imidazole glycerol phosphate synthase subunit HisF [Vibrio rotiferianus]CAH1528188.1 Putative imidazole glycerol phosphate synthase subunit hisF2 [Vibrio rotiferianus]
MLFKRVIPSILFSDGGLHKTVKFKNKKYVGDPINTVRLFNDLEVDELILLDIDASRQALGPNFELIEEIASECFMPVCYGGGIRSLEDAERIFQTGVEKVAINHQSFKNKQLISDLAQVFGSQSIVLSVDIKKSFFGSYKLFSHKEKKNLSISYLKHIEECVEAGVGEVLLTSVDREGTLSGFELDLISEVSSSVSIPVIAHGGGNTLSDIQSAFESGASAVSCGAKFIYEGPHRAVLINYLNHSEYNVINPIE